MNMRERIERAAATLGTPTNKIDDVWYGLRRYAFPLTARSAVMQIVDVMDKLDITVNNDKIEEAEKIL